MRLRNIKNKEEIINSSKYIVLNPAEYKGKWKEVFDNDNPIYIEIGMGKGKFIRDNALKYKDINFIGIEKFDTVIAKAIKNTNDYDVPNLRLIRADASTLNDIFDKEIDKIYLTFSDPWPKDRHEKRRLTSKNFLSIYDNLFKNDKVIEFKTDNKGLFNYSIVSLSQYGYKIEYLNVDLHSSDEEVITTEYEEKFMKLGPIYKVICRK